VELNAFTAPALIEYVENQLRANGVRGKVIPPDRLLTLLAEMDFSDMVKNEVKAVILRLTSADERGRKIAKEILTPELLAQARQWIEEGFAANPESAWDGVLVDRFHRVIAERSDKIDAKVQKELKKAIRSDP
jgi:hypothetical protein